MPLMQEKFPELGLVREDCVETSWIESVLYLFRFPKDELPEVFLNRTQAAKDISKEKSEIWFRRNLLFQSLQELHILIIETLILG